MSPKITPDSSFFAPAGDDPARLAQALKESHELLALAEQSAGIGIWDTDLATDMVRATPTFFRIMGLPVRRSRCLTTSFAPCAIPTMPRGCARASGRRSTAAWIPTKSSTASSGRSTAQLRWIFGRGRTVRDDAGKPVRYSGVDIDITERKQAEEHVRLLLASSIIAPTTC